ncbi:MAG: hypothetical protein AAF725_04835 [Acidobacteriota bacterium]
MSFHSKARFSPLVPAPPLLSLLLAGAIAAAAGAPCAAWTPQSQRVIGEQAARLVPPDLYRQLARNRPSYLVGLADPFKNAAAEDRYLYRDGRGGLDAAIRRSVQHAIQAIRSHRPFNDIAYRCGVVAHYVALANNPVFTAADDPEQNRWARDFLSYLESAEPRMELVFYGFEALDRPLDLDRRLAETLDRSRGYYPLVGREYRRIGFGSGRQKFDDRSTAYALAALGHSHAISDIAEVLRYIWLEAGGVDERPQLPRRGRQFSVLRPNETPPRTR